VPANLVADARDRHELLDQGHLHQLVEGERHLSIDHPGHLELPARKVNRGRDERGVDPVEGVIGRHDRAQAGDLQACARFDRRRRLDCLGDLGACRGRLRRAVLEHPASEPATNNRQSPETQRLEEEHPPRRRSGGGSVAGAFSRR